VLWLKAETNMEMAMFRCRFGGGVCGFIIILNKCKSAALISHTIQCESKNPRLRFSEIFSQAVGNF